MKHGFRLDKSSFCIKKLSVIPYICSIRFHLKYISLLLFLFLFLKSKSQDPLFTKIDKSNGLPGNAIYHIFQDSKGYMWFSGDKGLVKYDGFEFTTFNNEFQSSKSGTNIQEDKYGRIWYQNFDGYVFYIEKDSLHRLSQNTPVGYFNYGIVGDHLFLMQAEGLDVYDTKTLKIKKHIYIDTKKMASTASDLHHYYVYNDQTMHIFDENLTDHTVSIPAQLNSNGYSKFISAQNSVFIYAKNNTALHLCYQVSETQIKASFSLDFDNIQNASYTGDAFWFCTNNGAYRLSDSGRIENNGNAYFKDYNISYVFRDREDNFWFSTLHDGLLFVKNLNTRQYFRSIQPIRATLFHDHLYVGGSGGELYDVHLPDQHIKEVYRSPYNKEITALYYDSVHKTCVISNNEIEILDTSFRSTWHSGGALKDVKLIDSNYYAMALSGACALYKIDKNKADKWTTIYNRFKAEHFPFARYALGSRAKTVEYDAFQSTVYFGTSYGLKILTPEGLSELKIDTARLYINKLCRYKEIIYGLSSAGELIQISKNKAQRISLSLPGKHDAITFIKICGHYLFLTDNDQLFRVDLDHKPFGLKHCHKINYDITDIELQDQQLIIITQNGIIIEQLNNPEDQKSNPLFYITGLMVNSQAMACEKPIELRYDQNNIELKYSILSFKTDFTYPLYYKINSAAWEKAGDQTRTLNLSSLAPGCYKITFHLGDITTGASREQVIEFTIRKAWWQTWWFMGIWLSLIILCVVLIARWRIHELKQKNKLLNEKIENEQKYYKTSLKAIKAQMNPHFFYNALNTIQSFIYSEDKKNASTYLSKFSKLTRLILEMSEKDNVTLTEEISTLQLYLDIEKVRFNDDFDFAIHCADYIHTNFIQLPPMIIQPYVENAIKHGLLHKKGLKTVNIRFSMKDHLLSVCIDDNGIGRKQSGEINSRKNQKHESFSSVANEQRLKILSEKNASASVQIIDKLDDFNQPAGTIVNLLIPVILTQK
ncbi:MAG: histidine kinase [Bacteroidetes bacterium]|nr:histidine kinase [Bacteroidota bacterium]